MVNSLDEVESLFARDPGVWLPDNLFLLQDLETDNGRRVFYDINANSNLRPSVAAAFGFDPFERVVDFLAGHLVESRTA